MPGRDARFELLTPRGAGGIAVLAVSGADRHVAVGELLAGPVRGVLPLAELRIDGRGVDHALCVERPGEAVVELHLHGSDAVVAAVEAAVGGFAVGAPTAAELLLRGARSEEQLALALEQLALGPFADFVRGIASLPPDARRREVAAARARGRVAGALARVARCALVGRQNAGKSTLMNRLAFLPRALAGATPGLTRDPVRETVTLAGYPYEIVDTAGEGPAADALDRIAQDRGRRAGEGAIRVVVADGSRRFGDVERVLAERADLVVRSKADLPAGPAWPELGRPVVEVSCVDPGAVAEVRVAVGVALRRVRGLGPAPRRGVGGPAPLDRRDERALDAIEVDERAR